MEKEAEAKIWDQAADIIEEEEGGFFGSGSHKEMEMQYFRIEACKKLCDIFRAKAAALRAA